jgi:hypothetical protein
MSESSPEGSPLSFPLCPSPLNVATDSTKPRRRHPGERASLFRYRECLSNLDQRVRSESLPVPSNSTMNSSTKAPRSADLFQVLRGKVATIVRIEHIWNLTNMPASTFLAPDRLPQRQCGMDRRGSLKSKEVPGYCTALVVRDDCKSDKLFTSPKLLRIVAGNIPLLVCQSSETSLPVGDVHLPRRKFLALLGAALAVPASLRAAEKGAPP